MALTLVCSALTVACCEETGLLEHPNKSAPPERKDKNNIFRKILMENFPPLIKTTGICGNAFRCKAHNKIYERLGKAKYLFFHAGKIVKD